MENEESWLVESERMNDRLRGGSVAFVRGEDCWVYDQSPTLARSGEDHGYIKMNKYLHWYEAFWGIAQEQIHEGLSPK